MADVLPGDVLKPLRIGHVRVARGQGVQLDRPFHFALVGQEKSYTRQCKQCCWEISNLTRQA